MAPAVKTIAEEMKDEADRVALAQRRANPDFIETLPSVGSILDSIGPRGEEIKVNGVAVR